jgi:hypothetical protein
MGWTVLYIAFGAVAVWLLGEVLLQYKARLRWRLLAFAGFSAVVVGVVALSSVVVIALGAVAFAVGQTFVTLSYRRGFSTGWALGGMPGSSRRRRDGGEPAPAEDADPVLEVSGLEEHRPEGEAGSGYSEDGSQGRHLYGPTAHDPYEAPGYDPPAYEPQPLPDETGEYGIYERDEPSLFEPLAAHGGQAGDYAAGYGYQEQHPYAPYAEPYPGYDTGQYAATASYDAYGTGGYPQEGYPAQGGYADVGYDAAYDAYGGAWVPQQREAGRQPSAEQPYGYQDAYTYGLGGYGGDVGYATGYGEEAYAPGNGYPYTEAGHPAEGYGYGYGYGNGYDAGAQGYGPVADGYGYDDQRGY